MGAPRASAPQALTATARWLRIGAVGAAVLVADQLTKWWAVNALADGPIEVLGPLQLRLVRNLGSAFGLLPGAIAPFIAIAAVVVVVVLLRASRTLEGWGGPVAVGLVLGGAVGNLVDRVFRQDTPGPLGGAVIDFVDLGWWPVFNVADAAIVVGAAVLVLVLAR